MALNSSLRFRPLRPCKAGGRAFPEDPMPDPLRSLARNPDQASERIDWARAELVDSILNMRLLLARNLSWRDWVRRKPVGVILAAFAAGYLLARRRPPRKEDP